MAKPKIHLTRDPIPQSLARMAVPMALGLVATMSFNFVDTWFVSGLGGDALAALSFTFPVVMLCLSLAIGLGAGSSSVVARAAGGDDPNQVKVLVTDGISLTLLLTGLLSLLGLLTLNPTFRLLGASETVLPLIREYMVLWYCSTIFMAVPMVALASLRALGDTQFQARVMIGMAVANALLDPILIFGWWIFPSLGIEGAALATLLVRIASAVLVFQHLYARQLLVNPFDLARARQSWRKILHIGLPAMSTNMIIPAAGAVVIATIATHGQDAVAGFGVAARVESMALIAFYALSAVIGPFCGQNLGAGYFDRLQQAVWVCARFCLVAGLAVALVLGFSAEWIGRAFGENEDVVAVVKLYLYLVPISYFAYGVVMVVNAAFNGLGKPMPGVLLSSARVIVIFFPLMFLGNYWWGLTGILSAMSIANVCVGVWALIWMLSAIQKMRQSNFLS
ncbi:MATE family efflux transporter [Teredinibacter waterburyi]|uniref:MATE family efflux transporter n=1 Tax=Teredinibacter waterburyi TaxID=1500538 RepID=UPI001FECADF0|nr:MATE family efflux transporter [Teredinibacter waterburyi]